jgi:hypothetical protein
MRDLDPTRGPSWRPALRAAGTRVTISGTVTEEQVEQQSYKAEALSLTDLADDAINRSRRCITRESG